MIRECAWASRSVEERSIREAGQRIMKRLMGKLGREHALFGDVAFGNYEIQRLPVLSRAGDSRLQR